MVASALGNRGVPVFCLFTAYKGSKSSSIISSECLYFGGGKLEHRG